MAKNPEITHIIFDLADVCITGIKGLEKEVKKYNPCIDEYEFEKRMYGKNFELLIKLFEGKISEEQYWKSVTKSGKNANSPEFFKRIVRDSFRPVPGTEDIIKKLKTNQYPVGLLSDHAREWIYFIESKFSFMYLFDVRCYSFQSGYTKLSPKSFEYALSMMDANPETTLFIDDSPKNLVIAKSAGIKYVHQFTNASSLENNLLLLKVF